MRRSHRMTVGVGLAVGVGAVIWLGAGLGGRWTAPGVAKAPTQTVVAVVPPEPAPQSRLALALFPAATQAELKDAVAAVLPADWTVQLRLGGCPSDWHSFDDRAGLCVEATAGKEWLHVWFLPVDWIGIRKLSHWHCRTCYWEGVLKNDRFTIITHASDDTWHHRCDRLLNAWTPSLCNGGSGRAKQLFGYHSKTVDRTAMMLVERFCRGGRDLGEAANSLIVLGVPAKSVMLKALREVKPGEMVSGLGFDGIYGVLGDMGDPESVGVLCDRLRQTSSKYVVYALAGHSHPKLGPALRAAIRQATDVEDIAAIAREIGHQNYRPAAPDVAAAFTRVTNDHYLGDVAHALAALEYRPALPLIEAAVARLPADADGGFRDGGLRTALRRFTGDWGVPAANARVHIVGPKVVRVGDKAPLTILVEVRGAESMWRWDFVEYSLYMNGKPLIERPEILAYWGGTTHQIRPGGLMTLSYDLGPHLRSPGVFKVRYGDGKSAPSSNEIIIEVTPK